MSMDDMPEYRIWKRMKSRCYNKNTKDYSYYGGRGIEVCENWRSSFHKFYKDMGSRPSGLTLDRINPDKSYSPENCRWATRREQSINQRIRRDNKSGFKGVSRPTRGNGWVATARYLGKTKFIGYFKTPELASAAYQNFVELRDAR